MGAGDTRNGCGSMRVARLVGNAVSAAEHQRAGRVCQGGSHLSPEVSFFQASGSPVLPSSLRLSGVCFWIQHWRCVGQTPPRWNVQPSTFQQPLTVPHCDKTWRRVSMNAHDQRFGDLRVPLFDHVNAISPTGPMCCHARPHRGHQTQPSQRERQL